MSFDGSTIKYDFAQNHGFLDALDSGLGDARALQDEVNTVFNVLYSVYEGEGAQALQLTHKQLAGLMEQAVQDMVVGNTRGRDQQDLMAALDRANAADLI
ncbi:hypothetical protein [Mycolicibacterium goodii]|uniref:Uncharacterized protein n=1 Tax=Mycolicibacterium goodii TaxID=134601 RepID=A0A0K0X2H5_MYCGD|nr:hypothetical protein AFA91_06845 [Mycolicibacterium goodii]